MLPPNKFLNQIHVRLLLKNYKELIEKFNLYRINQTT